MYGCVQVLEDAEKLSPANANCLQPSRSNVAIMYCIEKAPKLTGTFTRAEAPHVSRSQHQCARFSPRFSLARVSTVNARASQQ